MSLNIHDILLALKRTGVLGKEEVVGTFKVYAMPRGIRQACIIRNISCTTSAYVRFKYLPNAEAVLGDTLTDKAFAFAFMALVNLCPLPLASSSIIFRRSPKL